MPKEREDVEATLEQGTTPDASPQKGKWRAIDWIAGGTVIAEVLWGLWWLITQVRHLIPWSPYVSIEHFCAVLLWCGSWSPIGWVPDADFVAHHLQHLENIEDEDLQEFQAG